MSWNSCANESCTSERRTNFSMMRLRSLSFGPVTIIADTALEKKLKVLVMPNKCGAKCLSFGLLQANSCNSTGLHSPLVHARLTSLNNEPESPHRSGVRQW